MWLLSLLTLRGLSGDEENLFLDMFSDQNILYEYLRGGYFCIGAGIAQWLERRTRRSKGRGFESLLERRENFLLQGRLSVPPVLPQ